MNVRKNVYQRLINQAEEDLRIQQVKIRQNRQQIKTLTEEQKRLKATVSEAFRIVQELREAIPKKKAKMCRDCDGVDGMHDSFQCKVLYGQIKNKKV